MVSASVGSPDQIVPTVDRDLTGDQGGAAAVAPNSDPVAPDEPANIPRWRLDLLDLAFQKALYSDPPIPIEAERRDATGTRFEIRIAWDVDAASRRPTKLHLTIFCPGTLPDGTTAAL
jgi:hypothetical protein